MLLLRTVKTVLAFAKVIGILTRGRSWVDGRVGSDRELGLRGIGMAESRLLGDVRAGMWRRVRSWLVGRVGVGWDWGLKGIGKGDRMLLGEGNAGEKAEAMRGVCERGTSWSWAGEAW